MSILLPVILPRNIFSSEDDQKHNIIKRDTIKA